jgi:hypothetical protein
MAEALGEQGARVLIASRKQAELDEACAHLAWATRLALLPSLKKRCGAWARSTSSSTTPARPGARRPRTFPSRPGTR